MYCHVLKCSVYCTELTICVCAASGLFQSLCLNSLLHFRNTWMDNRGRYGGYPLVQDPSFFRHCDEEVEQAWATNFQPPLGLSQVHSSYDLGHEGGPSALRAEPVEDIQATQTTGESIRLEKGVRQRNFSEREDCLLASAWLNVSLDPIHGTNQSKSTYWGRITEYYSLPRPSSSSSWSRHALLDDEPSPTLVADRRRRYFFKKPDIFRVD